jgi:hypothetical protein
MNTVGPAPLSSVLRPEEPSLTFRANQRITADVIQIASDHVVLELQGVQIVGRLMSQDQAALLADKRTAQFIVRGMQGQTPVLQMLTDEEAGGSTPAQGASAMAADLIPHLLELAGLPNDAATTAIARALIGRGLPISKELVDELRGTLGGIDQWGDQQAAAAALLKASGLPVSKASIELVAGNGLQEWVDTAVALRAHLQTMASSGKLDPELARTLQTAVQTLTTLLVRWDGSPATIADALQKAVQLAGKSIEHELARQIQQGGEASSQDAPSLLNLANMRRELIRAGAGQLVGELDKFIEGMRVMHLFNVQPQQAPARGQWLSIDLPVGVPVPGDAQRSFGPDQHFAKLRVAYRAEGDERKIDSGSTRLVIQADVDGGETIEVDLSVIAKTIGAHVTASSEALRGAAETEMPALRDGLEHLGYALQSTVYDVGGPTPIITLDEPASKVALSEINIRA